MNLSENYCISRIIGLTGNPTDDEAYRNYVRDLSPYDVGILTPIFEEIPHRGILQPQLTSWLNSPISAILLSSLLFGALRLRNPHPYAKEDAFFATIGGIISGFLNQNYGFFAPLGKHMTLNSLVYTIAMLKKSPP